MSDITVELLDLTIEENITAYEEAQYEAFADSEIITLKDIWAFDHEQKRLRAKVPYEDQIIYVARIEGKIVAAASVNANMNGPLQLETMGFSIDKSEEHICEGLGIFSLQVFHNDQPILFELRDATWNRLNDNKIHTIYGTCSKRKLRGYKILGFTVIGTKEFHGETKYLLRIEIDKK